MCFSDKTGTLTENRMEFWCTNVTTADFSNTADKHSSMFEFGEFSSESCAVF